jgi:hypothetical protein
MMSLIERAIYERTPSKWNSGILEEWDDEFGKLS